MERISFSEQMADIATNINKFSFIEAFNNGSGKTSANKIVGMGTSIICLILLIALVGFYFFNTGEASTIMLLIDKITMYFGIAAGIMGVKSISSAFGKNRVIIGNAAVKKKKPIPGEDHDEDGDVSMIEDMQMIESDE